MNSKAIIFTDDDKLGLLLKKTIESARLHYRVTINPSSFANGLRGAVKPLVIVDLDILTFEPDHILGSVSDKTPEAKIIILTSKDSFSRAEGREVLGGHQYLKKPGDVEEFKFVLERMDTETSSNEIT